MFQNFSRRTMMVILAACMAACFTACGQKGDLYHPEDKQSFANTDSRVD